MDLFSFGLGLVVGLVFSAVLCGWIVKKKFENIMMATSMINKMLLEPPKKP